MPAFFLSPHNAQSNLHYPGPDNADLIVRCAGIEKKRAQSQPTVPSLLSEELATNPFLRASDARIRAQLKMTDASDSEVFAEIRSRKDNF